MSHDYQFEREQIIFAPRGEVFAFFSNAANLETLTPPWLGFHILTPLPLEMRSGTLIDYSIRLRGIPLKWRTRIEAFEPPNQFVDTQVIGPYAFWHHTHSFETHPQGTRMTDRVRYRMPLGPLGRLAHWLFVSKDLHTIFEYRRTTIERLFHSNPSFPA